MKRSIYGTEYIDLQTEEHLANVKDLVIEDYMNGEREEIIVHVYRLTLHHMINILKARGVFRSVERSKAVKERIKFDNIKSKKAKELYKYYCKTYPNYKKVEAPSPNWTNFCIKNIVGDNLEIILFNQSIMNKISDIVGYEVRAVREEISKKKIRHTIYIPFDNLTTQMIRKILNIGCI